MSENELAKSLLNLELKQSASDNATRVHVGKILERDKWRVRILAWATMVFWLLAAIALYWCMISVIMLYAELQQGRQPNVRELAYAVYLFLILLSASLEALIFAFLGTFWLLFLSRKVTLRQINVNLLQISEQLRRLESSSRE